MAPRNRYAKSKKKKTLPIWLIVVGIVAISAVALGVYSLLADPTGVVTPTRPAYTTADGIHLGNPEAKVVVEEFADFQCPGCALYWKNFEPGILQDYVDTGKVYYSFHPYSFLGKESINAAKAAFCAEAQGKFWEYRDYLFGNQTGENVGDFTTKRLFFFAKKLSLDMEAFKSCYRDEATAARVTESSDYARSKSINLTPSFTVNGTVVNAAQLTEAIEAELAK